MSLEQLQQRYQEDPEELDLSKLSEQDKQIFLKEDAYRQQFISADSERDFNKAREQLIKDTSLTQEQKSRLFNNTVANTEQYQKFTNKDEPTNTSVDTQYQGNDIFSKMGVGNMGLSNKQQVGMSLGLNTGVAALNMVDNALMGNKNFGAQSEAIDSAVHGVSSALMKSGNPYAMAAGAGLEVINFATKATGQTVQGFDVNINNSGYGTMGHKESKSNRDFLSAIGLAGIDNRAIERQLIERNTEAQMAMKASNISEDIKFEQEARMNQVGDIIKQNQIALAGGLDSSVLVAKKGAKIQKLKEHLKNKKEPTKVTIKNIYLKITTEQLSGDTPITIQGKEYLIVPVEEVKSSENKVVKARNGAKLKNIEVSEQQSIIPEGTLHKNKHHLDVEGVTKKGIPVITVEDDSVETLEEIKEQEDTIVQHAEIESQEVIYNKELTDYVEDSLKEWEESKEDSILIEVGKRICKELLFNTEDPDNLIKQQKI